MILKSGCNFNNFHYLTIDFSKQISSDEKLSDKKTLFNYKNYQILVEQVDINEKFQENEELKLYVDNYLRETEKELEKVI